MSDIVREYYDGNAELEWRRLERDRIEFAITRRALREYLPPPPANVLDIGGGPGRYAMALAGAGYDVTLADFSGAELDVARAQARAAGVTLAGIVQADARDLTEFADASFDAVVMLGPLYHLLAAEDRLAAISEARRVLRNGGRFFAAYITRTAVLRYFAKYDPVRVAKDPSRYIQQIATGEVRENAEFTDIYLAHPTEIVPVMEQSGFQTKTLISCEGVISMIRDRVNELEGDDWMTWVSINYVLAKDPSNHGCAEHLLYVGQKPM